MLHVELIPGPVREFGNRLYNSSFERSDNLRARCGRKHIYEARLDYLSGSLGE